MCSENRKIFCYLCRAAKANNLLSVTPTRKYQPAFVEDGFNNFKKAIDRFRAHEDSNMHKEVVLKRSTGVRVDTLLSTQLATDQLYHRTMLMKLLSTIKFLVRQGLPLRGKHDGDDPEGNLAQLLLLRAEEDKKMLRWLKQRDYLSPEIVNEIITKMGQFVLRDILSHVKESRFYSILADEATDVSHQEQMCLSVRWIDEDLNVHEDGLGLFQLPDTKACTVFSAIKDILIRCTLPLCSIRGQAYDGASTMSGIRNGVQALMKSEVPEALYVHCLAHNLNLVLKDVTNKSELVRNVMDFIYNLVQLIRFSPKRLSLFDSLRKDIALQGDGSTPSLRVLCPTRWTVRHTAINSILRNYQVLIDALEIIQKGHDEYAAKANGLLGRMECFDTYFALKLAYLVFSASEQLSINLQAVDLTIQEATTGASLLASHLKALRTESKFDQFYSSVCEESKHFTEEPKLPRQRKLPKRYNTGSTAHQYTDPKSRFRRAYYEVLELAGGEIDRRFDQKDMKIMKIIKEIEILLLNAANGRPYDIEILPPSVKSFLEKDFDLKRLCTHLALVADMVKQATPQVTTVTNIRTIAQAINSNHIYKKMLSEVFMLLSLYFTFPVTTASAERSFSALRRLKTFLRSTMTECRLNNLFLLYVHKHRTDRIDLLAIAKDFISVNSRRQRYFGEF